VWDSGLSNAVIFMFGSEIIALRLAASGSTLARATITQVAGVIITVAI
jgi:hypothetical protein